MLTITHSVASSLPLGSRNVRFLHVAFDTAGERFIAGDCHGNIFLFDIRRNMSEAIYVCLIKSRVYIMSQKSMLYACWIKYWGD